MKLFKIDTTKWEVRVVEGCPYPGIDSEGEKCYVNTHFATETEAWVSLKGNAESFVKLAAYIVEDTRRELERAEKNASDAACAMAKVLKNIPENICKQ